MSNYFTSVQLERRALAGLLVFPSLFSQLQLENSDFTDKVHESIFKTIEQALDNAEDIDHQIIANKISSFGITYKNEINIYDYLESLSLTKITEEGLKQTAEELKTLTLKRKLQERVSNLINIVKDPSMSRHALVEAFEDEIHKSIINIDEKPKLKPLFSDLSDIKSYSMPSKFWTGYNNITEYLGPLRGRNIHAIYSSPKQRISTILSDIAIHVSQSESRQVLYLDTKTDTAEYKLCRMHENTGIPFSDLENREFKKDNEKYEKLKSFLKELASIQLYHKYIGGASIKNMYREIHDFSKDKISPFMVIIDSADYRQSFEDLHLIKDLLEKSNSTCILSVEKPADLDNIFEIESLSCSEFIWRAKTLNEVSKDGSLRGSHKLIPLRYKYMESGGHNIAKYNKQRLNEDYFAFYFELQTGKPIEKGTSLNE